MPITVKKILNSAKKPTVEINYNGFIASAPAGTSAGKHEKPSFAYTVDYEIATFKKHIPSLEKIHVRDFEDLEMVEKNLKGFGSSIIIALEYAIIKSKGGYKWLGGKKIPRPLGNCIGGGAHGGSMDFQEFLVMDKKNESIMEAFFKNMKAHKFIQEEIEPLDKSFNNKTTLEGAWAPNIETEQALDILHKAGKKFNLDIGIDIAASTFWNGKVYKYKNHSFTRDQQIEYVNHLIHKYNLYYIEDPLEQEDFDGFSQLAHKKCLITGDDLTTTNPERLQKALDFGSINAIIIKPNQIGSLIKTKQVIDMAKQHHLVPVLSHRSGETTDNTLSHLAVGFETPILKIGILGKERTSKIQELVRIEKEIAGR